MSTNERNYQGGRTPCHWLEHLTQDNELERDEQSREEVYLPAVFTDNDYFT
jgi:hypothetical protein